MAYNPSMYESVYGFSFLDELHNFFPELLYDDTLFDSEIINWMRFRVNRLFSHIYVRQQNMYTIYSATQRMNDYARWHHYEYAPLPSHNLDRSVPHYATYSTIPVRTRARPTAQPPLQPQTTRPIDISGSTSAHASQNRNMIPPLFTQFNRPIDISGSTSAHASQNRNMAPTLFTSLIYDIYDTNTVDVATNLINLLSLPSFQNVTVAPSNTQIENASILRNHTTMPTDTDCTICMEHAHANGDLIWRELRCGHMFHRQCIDTWFSSHVQCPICRTDIRNMSHPQPSSTR